MDSKDGDHRENKPVARNQIGSGPDYSSGGATWKNSFMEDRAVAVCVGCKRPDNTCHLCKKKLPSGKVFSEFSDGFDTLLVNL
ncbi:hypothetical protein A3K01_00815 [candidate division WWE3 bacterium RIFOXYD1_FULL_43_17]|uniref:Uncharacterized protein n=3 Tax=Katanobacteria TaxID=422282 RepID=A0A1F4XEW7_UNCKA|nr:MAG: hypothetical protein UU59_C0017G0007 [candidate division WWE3 bacterium GW2011_GWE1_41_27]KKS59860.1 MAG: hypothetical protein UV26_C0013G0007 [candidate division WWE3 bacterium GW2011_GWF2_42_42]OGC80227.1 MAG: hypothetical protein A3K01_00815 [candidate division WWE3 bacterium RIFOXYD1_FULL_43_17]